MVHVKVSYGFLLKQENRKGGPQSGMGWSIEDLKSVNL